MAGLYRGGWLGERGINGTLTFAGLSREEFQRWMEHCFGNSGCCWPRHCCRRINCKEVPNHRKWGRACLRWCSETVIWLISLQQQPLFDFPSSFGVIKIALQPEWSWRDLKAQPWGSFGREDTMGKEISEPAEKHICWFSFKHKMSTCRHSSDDWRRVVVTFCRRAVLTFSWLTSKFVPTIFLSNFSSMSHRLMPCYNIAEQFSMRWDLIAHPISHLGAWIRVL